MAQEEIQTAATVEVASAGSASGHPQDPNILAVQFPLLGLTWVTFLLLAVLLYKVAWRPILNALDTREKAIRDAVEDAEKARADAEATEARNRETLQKAADEARRIVAEAKAAAQESARLIQERSERETEATIREARRQIQSATEEARTTLRREAADLAIAMASRVVGENMDSERNNALVRNLTGEL